MAVSRAVLVVLLLAGVCFAQTKAAAPKQTYKTALEALKANPDLSKFVDYAEVVGILPYLNATVTKGTILAPTNAAIDALLGALKVKHDGVVKSGNKTQILLDRLVGYHTITAAAVKSSGLKNGQKITTAGNGTLEAIVGPSGVSFKGAQNTAKVTKADIVGGNVVIHAIDTVLLPATVFPTIKDALAFSPTTKTLAGLIAKDPTLSKAAADPTTAVTLLAPANKALDAFIANPANKAAVSDPATVGKVLAYHAVKGARVLPDWKAKGTQVLPTLLAGQSVSVTKAITDKAANKGVVKVTADSAGAKPAVVKKFNIIAGASYINIIDGVLVPKL